MASINGDLSTNLKIAIRTYRTIMSPKYGTTLGNIRKLRASQARPSRKIAHVSFAMTDNLRTNLCDF